MITNILDDLMALLKNDPTLSTDHSLLSKLKPLLSSSLKKMDIVSRDEFDAQSAVLLRTREKLEQMEQQFNELEQQLAETKEK